ncbi:hypothetical protein ILUMI_08087 [Ignelater luminosus]|uniref:Uncharacterized protein n=1 Tax=Ignelater luminosus TaxID=2038154 RepID=A0A8K0D876_IGNLU|nr:hypothetical protein ILUMI_08087 [Ignelater luminosus]
MPETTEIRELTRKRGGVNHKLTNFVKHAVPIYNTFKINPCLDDEVIIELQDRLDKLEIIYNEFEGIQLEIEFLSPDDVLEGHYKERDEKPHKIYTCKELLQLSIDDRIAKVSELNLCKNCLCSGHESAGCKAGSCKVCKQKHNKLLHPTVNEGSYVMLSTVCAYIYDKAGNPHICNCLLENGSQPNFVTSNLVRNLELDEIPVNISINGVSNVIANVRSKCNVWLASMHNNFNLKLSCYVLPTITGCLPNVEVNISDWKLPDNVSLADPKCNIPKQIDLLIGSSHFWRIARAGIIHLGKGMPVLQNTEFGYTVTVLPEVYADSLGKICKLRKRLYKLKHIRFSTEFFYQLTMNNRNAVRNHIESLSQLVDAMKRKTSSPFASLFFLHGSSLFQSVESGATERLKQVSKYIEALEENIIQQENTIANKNEETESIKRQLSDTILENTKLKYLFDKETKAQLKLLKEKDEDLIMMTKQIQNLQKQLDDNKELSAKDSKTDNKSTTTAPELSIILEELKATQLEEFAIMFREFENRLFNCCIEKMANFENKLQKAAGAPQKTYSSNNCDKTELLNESFRKGNTSTTVQKVIGDKEEVD